MAENNEYEGRVDILFASQEYPSVEGLTGGAVIQGCWEDQYSDMASLIRDQYLAFGAIRGFLSMLESNNTITDQYGSSAKIRLTSNKL